jgi:hypothetical protein
MDPAADCQNDICRGVSSLERSHLAIFILTSHSPREASRRKVLLKKLGANESILNVLVRPSLSK